MIIDNYSSTVRVCKIFGNSFENFFDDVEVQKLIDGEWKVQRRFNSISSDYAYTNAREYALELASKSAMAF
jgi:hypothetical protein